MRFRFIVLFLTLVLIGSNAQAVWFPNGNNLSANLSRPACDVFAGCRAYYPRLASDGDGGAIAAWDLMGPFGYQDIGACRVDETGSTLWRIVVCNESSIQQYSQLTDDGNGGAIIVWFDNRTTGSGPGIYAQRVNAAGAPQWASNGVRVCASPAEPYVYEPYVSIGIVSDGAGGAFVMWRDDRYASTEPDIYVQRVFANGTTWSSADGISVTATPPHTQEYADIASDGSGGAIVTWATFNPFQDIWAQRMDGTGARMWGTNGAPVCEEGGGQYYPRITEASAGGAIVVWEDIRNGGNKVFAQRLDDTGAQQWTEGGISISGPTGVVTAQTPRLTSDGADGAFVAWIGDGFNPGVSRDAVAVRVQSNGVVGSRLPLSAAPSNASDASITSDGLGGAFVAWHHATGTLDDIYVQWLDSASGIKLKSGGAVVCDAPAQQRYTQIGPSSAGRAIVAWEDERNGLQDVFGLLVMGNTETGGNVVVAPVDATTGTTPATLTFSNVTGPGSTSLTTGPSGPPLGTFSSTGTYYNLSTTATFTGSITVCVTYNPALVTGPESGVKLLHFNGTSWVDITTSVDTNANIVCGTTTSLSPFAVGPGTPTGVGDGTAPRLALHQNVPNPFNPVTTIAFDVPPGGAEVTIGVYDLTGRLVRTLVDTHREAGQWSVQWSGEDDRGNRVSSGVYFYRMRAGAFAETKKMVLLK